tara:strand:- start:690 stop:833 length:144 start_codon:yes stop_codon:yes gene_type:complete
VGFIGKKYRAAWHSTLSYFEFNRTADTTYYNGWASLKAVAGAGCYFG